MQRNLSRAQDGWFSVLRQLEGRRGELEALLQDWRAAQAGLDDGLHYLKEVRQQLLLPLPDTFDQLTLELQKCKVAMCCSEAQ